MLLGVSSGGSPKLVVTGGSRLGARKSLGGVFQINTILQPPPKEVKDNVTLEVPGVEVRQSTCLHWR